MILDRLAEAAAKRVEKAKDMLPLKNLKDRLYDGDRLIQFHGREDFAFERKLRKTSRTELSLDTNTGRKQTAFICEVKKASPSKGVIAREFPYLDIAREYVEAGADAISVLTEPEYFQGADRYLSEISKAVPVPVLRKDFIIEEYQIYESRLIGADAVLLICSLLDTQTLHQLITLSDALGLSTLVEAHNETEIISAMQAGARIIGVNNRNLRTFEVDFTNSIRLRTLVPEEILFVAESGIHTAEDVNALRKAGVDAVLIGEALMRSSDKKELLHQMRQG